MIIIIAVPFLMRKCNYRLCVIKVALYELLLYFYIVFIKSLIIILNLGKETHCFSHVTLVVCTHSNFHFDFHFTFNTLKCLRIALLSLFILFHFLVCISQEFLGPLKFHEILMCSLALVHQEISLTSHQVRILKVWENRNAIRDGI